MIADIETHLADPEIYQDNKRAAELMKEYKDQKAKLETLYEKMGKGRRIAGRS